MLSSNIKQVAALLRQGHISAKELCEKCLQRIEKVKDLNAYITVTADLARAQADRTAERAKQGELLSLIDGIPVAFKDNYCTAGTQTSCGSRMLDSYVPPYNATMVQRLQDQGAVLTGKTNLDEFAMGVGGLDSLYGPIKNPWTDRSRNHKVHEQKLSKQQDPAVSESQDVCGVADWCIAGGSSGGSAVAVATGSVFGALGSDTGGSVRNPAAYCGVVGLKPTYGRLSRHGLVPLTNSLDVPGILTRTIDDAAILLNYLSGHDPLDSTTVRTTFDPVTLADEPQIQGLHIGIPKEYHAPGLSEDVLSAWGDVADLMESAGARVSQVSLPHTQLSIVCYHTLGSCEVASNMARYDGIQYGHRVEEESSTETLYASSRHEGFNDVVRGRILAGNYFLLRENYDKYFVQAMKVRRLITKDFKDVFGGGVDLLLTPTVLSDAPKYSWFSAADNRTRTAEQDVFTQPINMAGIPAVSMPVRLSNRGLPVSLQLIGQSFQEKALLHTAKWLENRISFPPLDLSHLDES